MKKVFLTILFLLGVAQPAKALVCMAPDPVCLAIVVAMVGAITADGQSELPAPYFDESKQSLDMVTQSIAHDEALMMKLSDYRYYNPGLSDVMTRPISGSVSLESLAEFNPSLFVNLDKVAELIGQSLGKDSDEIYGSPVVATENGTFAKNWERYRMLAHDANIVFANSFSL